ncbi:NUDIX domain-containing protein [Corynebacterium frankenforstense]
MSTPGTHTFTVTDSETLVDAPILAVRRDQVVMPGGTTADREIVEHFGAVAVVAYDAERDAVAMVRQYRHAVGTRLLELPAGILDFTGEDPLSAARRELGEEAGLDADRWDSLVDLVTSPGFCDEAVRVFLARDLRAVERPESEDEEADMSLEWIGLDAARDAVHAGEVANSIAVAGVLAAHDVLRHGAAVRPADAEFTLRPQALARRRQAAGIVPDMKKL